MSGEIQTGTSKDAKLELKSTPPEAAFLEEVLEQDCLNDDEKEKIIDAVENGVKIPRDPTLDYLVYCVTLREQDPNQARSTLTEKLFDEPMSDSPMQLMLQPPHYDKNWMFVFDSDDELATRALDRTITDFCREKNIHVFHQIGPGEPTGFHGFELWSEVSKQQLTDFTTVIGFLAEKKYEYLKSLPETTASRTRSG